jgi:hypothetical protein
LGEGIVNYFEVKNCSEILEFEAVESCNRFLMLNLGLIQNLGKSYVVVNHLASSLRPKTISPKK